MMVKGSGQVVLPLAAPSPSGRAARLNGGVLLEDPVAAAPGGAIWAAV